ncbi:MAG: 2-hydroxyacyl-CoA dehydratase [Povalibacter sp.]
MTSHSGRTIGYVGCDIPVELILAAGATPLGVHGRADQVTPHADRYLEATFTSASRSIAEQWLNGELDHLEAVIFSRSDDSAQRLYYYLCELQRRGLCAGPRPLMYDIAAITRESSLAHTIASTRQLARDLGVSDGALVHSLERVRERNDLLLEIVGSTMAKPAARGSFTQRTLRAAGRDWSSDFDETLRSAQDPTPARSDATPLLLIGSSPADERLHESAERADANIVATLNAATPYRFADTAREGDVFEQIARRCRAHPWREMLQSPQAFCARALELQVKGVILWVVAEDTGLAWVYPRVERALREHGISVLPLTMQKWNVPDETLDAVANFASTLRTQP